MMALASDPESPGRQRSTSLTGEEKSSLCWAMVNYFVDTRGWRDRIECKQSRKQILHNVHGYASPGTVTAIMVSWASLLVLL